MKRYFLITLKLLVMLMASIAVTFLVKDFSPLVYRPTSSQATGGGKWVVVGLPLPFIEGLRDSQGSAPPAEVKDFLADSYAALFLDIAFWFLVIALLIKLFKLLPRKIKSNHSS